MTAQDLRNAILQLAMQGKLVPQDPVDEPASELLRQIQSERLRLIKEGKIKKEKSLPSIVDEEILFDIPENWVWTSLLFITYGVGSKRNQILAKEVKQQGKFPAISQGQLFIDGYCDVQDKLIFDVPVILFGDHTRNVKYIDFPFVISADGTKLLKPIVVYPQYLYWWTVLTAERLRNRGYARHFALLKEQAVPLPPLSEQRRIVAKIEELLPYIEEYDAVENRLTALNKKFPDWLCKSILQQAIMGKLIERNPADEPASELLKRIRAEKSRLIEEGKLKKEKPLPPIIEDDIPFEIPAGWAWVYLDDLVIIRGGKRMPKGKQLITSPTDHIYVRVTDMQSGTILDNDLHYVPDDVYPLIQRYIIEKSDIYFVIVGSTIGKTGLVPEMFDGMNLTENAVRLTPIIIYKEFLYLVLDSAPIQQQFSEKIKQEGQPKLAITRLRSSIIPLPPLAEQQRIVERVEELLAVCGQLK